MGTNSDHVKIENVERGYRMWCDHCKVEAEIRPGPNGMPVTSFLSLTKAFTKNHKACRVPPILASRP